MVKIVTPLGLLLDLQKKQREKEKKRKTPRNLEGEAARLRAKLLMMQSKEAHHLMADFEEKGRLDKDTRKKVDSLIQSMSETLSRLKELYEQGSKNV